MHSTPQPELAPAHARPHITGLTGIRALAAAWVVIEHFRDPLFTLIPAFLAVDDYVKAGFLGVEVFFVLSGFIIAYTYADQFECFTWTSYRKFMLLRFARIYPVHLVTLATVLGLVGAAAVSGVNLNSSGGYTLGSFVANLLMLQAVPPFASWNGPAWSICAEFAAYLAFPIVALWVARIRTARAGLLTATAVMVIGATLMFFTATYINPSPTGYELIWLRISIEFTAGALLYAGWRHLGLRQQGPMWGWVAVGAAAGIMIVISTFGGDSAAILVASPLIGVFVLACASATGWLQRFLGSRPMVWGGKISYSVYMTHFILLMMFGKLIPWDAYADSALFMRVGLMAAYYFAVIVTGALCYYVVEEPVRHGIRRVAADRRAPARHAV